VINIEINLKEITFNDLIQNSSLLNYLIISSLSFSYEKKPRNIVHKINKQFLLHLDQKEAQSLAKIISNRLQELIAKGIVAKTENGYYLKIGNFDVYSIYMRSDITIK